MPEGTLCEHGDCNPPRPAIVFLPYCSPYAIGACERHVKDLEATFPHD